MRRKHVKIRLMSELLCNGLGLCTCLRERVCAGEGGVPRKKKNGAARLDPWEIFVMLPLKIPFDFISLRKF